MRLSFWNSEKLLSLSALLVSLLTLIVFVYQTNLIRKQQYRSVFPYLILSNEASGSLDYKYLMINQGIGPAMIQSIEVIDSTGTSYESILDYVNTQISDKDSIFFYNSDIYAGRLIPAGDQIPLFGMVDETQLRKYGVKNTVKGTNRLRTILNSDDLIIKITYASIYDERWLLESGALPISLD